MGWLKDAMEDKGVRSMAELARRLRARTDLPKAAKLEEKALGNQLGKLDRGQELSWWVQRPGADAILATELDIEIDVVRQALAGPRTRNAASLYPLDVVPDAQAIDLAVEDPFPGIPWAVPNFAEGGWGHGWWHEEDRVARDFAGRWLDQRGVTRLVVRDWKELADRLPEKGRVFVEVTHPTALVPQDDWVARHRLDPNPFGRSPAGETTEERRPAVPSGVRLFVAAPVPRQNGPYEPRNFEDVDTPPLTDWFEDLVRWVGKRIQGFRTEDTIVLLRKVRDQGHPMGPVDALALCSAIHRVGPEALDLPIHQQDLRTWVRPFLGTVFQPIQDRATTPTEALLRTRGSDVLARAVRAAMLEGAEPGDPHPRDAWKRWMPGDLVPEPDLDAAARIAGPTTKSLGADAIKRLREHIKPGPSQVVATLQAARLLEDDRNGEALILRPRWLAEALCASESEKILKGPCAEWGALGLNAQRFGDVVRERALAAADGRWKGIKEAVDALTPTDPASVQGLDAAFRAAGLAVTAGANISEPLARQLCEGAMRTSRVLEPGDGPRPMFDSTGTRHGLYGHPALWSLAWLALTEKLTEPLDGSFPAIAPWHREGADSTGPILHLTSAIPGVQVPTEKPTSRLWSSVRRGVMRLARRLADAGHLGEHYASLPLLAPTAVVDAVLAGELPDHGPIQQLARMTDPQALLVDAARDRNTTPDVVLAGVWRLDPRSGTPTAALRWADAAGERDVHMLWFSCPPSHLGIAAVARKAIETGGIERFDDEHWIALLVAESQRDTVSTDGLWTRAPARTIRKVITRIGVPNLVTSDARATWLAAPDEVLQALITQSDRDAAITRALIESPENKVDPLLDAYESGTVVCRDAWRRWAHHVVSGRQIGWRRAFRLLATEERHA